MRTKLFSFILLFTVVLLEAKLHFLGDLIFLIFFRKALINTIFPKDPNIMRVRNPNEVKTEANNVTILDFIGLTERHGYPAEEHYVTTEDGYNLVIHRIPGSPLFNDQQKKTVVFLQHGFASSSDYWVIIGAGKDLPFLLADQGYDVWLGNLRGNSYCRSHVKLSPQNRDFWQFSYHEMGTRDLPVMIDYVLSYTKEKTLRFIGHSMGATLLFVLLSIKLEYNAKIKLGILLGPMTASNETSFGHEYLLSRISNIKGFLDYNEIYEIPLSSKIITLGRILCNDKAITQGFCTTIFFLIAGFDPAQLNTTALPEILSHFPAGTSVQTVLHLFQTFITQKFQAYDYGFFGNYKQYGQKTPIMYDFQKVTAPLAMFYGANDLLAPKSNVLEIHKQLPNVILLEENAYKLFTHVDFLWAIDSKTLIHDRIIEVLQEFDMTDMDNR